MGDDPEAMSSRHWRGSLRWGRWSRWRPTPSEARLLWSVLALFLLGLLGLRILG